MARDLDQDREWVWRVGRQYAPDVLRLATYLVGPNEAPDVSQEAYISFLQWTRRQPASVLEDLVGSEKGVQRMLFRIVIRRAGDLKRRQRRQREELTESGLVHEVDGDVAVAAVQPMAVEIALVGRIIDSLPEEQRLVHILYHHWGYTDAEIGAILDLRRSTVRSHVHRARQTIKRRLRERGGGSP